MILDEPTNGLDPTQTEHMRQLIRDIAQDAAILLSTHIMQEVDALCDRVLILQGGQLMVDAKVKELRTSNHLLVTTTLPPEVAENLTILEGVDNLKVLTDVQNPAAPGSYQYRLTLAHEHEMDRIIATVAKTIIDADADLYQLQSEQRDLETLFREVSDAHAEPHRDQAGFEEELSDAA